MRHLTLLLLTALPLAATALNAADFQKANQVLRDGAIRSGDANFDPTTNLVRRSDMEHGRLDVCQRSLEYAAALFSAGARMDRANAVVSAVLQHQDLGQDSPTFGNFHWWGDETRVGDRNAVCFMSPWLSHIAMEHGDKFYADIFQQWHWEAAIGAGTHSRAYEGDRDTGHSLVSCLIFKQCGQPLRLPLSPFCYVFAVNETGDDARREIRWQAGDTQMRLEWDAANNRALSRTVNGREVEFKLRYDSPLIRLADGEPPAVVPRR